ncbi:MAG TPA: DoxX family protein [Gemmatimonadales bacterium]|nr:DoxX family protein [Gemmatimonadales bacterium]
MGARLLSLLRIVAAFTYMAHGTQKLFGFPGGVAHVEYVSLYGLAGVIETAGGLFLLLGLFTRPVAVITAGEMAVAYFLVHVRQGAWPLLNHGELAVVYCFLFLYIAAVGPGPWSLDRVLGQEEGDVRSTGARRLR